MCADHQGGAAFRSFSWAPWMSCLGECWPAEGLSVSPDYAKGTSPLGDPLTLSSNLLTLILCHLLLSSSSSFSQKRFHLHLGVGGTS